MSSLTFDECVTWLSGVSEDDLSGFHVAGDNYNTVFLWDHDGSYDVYVYPRADGFDRMFVDKLNSLILERQLNFDIVVELLDYLVEASVRGCEYKL